MALGKQRVHNGEPVQSTHSTKSPYHNNCSHGCRAHYHYHNNQHGCSDVEFVSKNLKYEENTDWFDAIIDNDAQSVHEMIANATM